MELENARQIQMHDAWACVCVYVCMCVCMEGLQIAIYGDCANVWAYLLARMCIIIMEGEGRRRVHLASD